MHPGAKRSLTGTQWPHEYVVVKKDKYWTMTDCADIDLEADDYVLNRARLYRDPRDFVIKGGDTGARGQAALDSAH